MKTRVQALGLACALAVVTAASPAAADHRPVIYPEAAGTTIIHAQGITGIAIEFPNDARLWTENVTIEPAVGTRYVGVYVGYQGQGPSDLCDLCFGTFFRGIPESGVPIFEGECTNDAQEEVGCPIEAGVLEIYFVSDGEMTFTMKFAELDGSAELEATGLVDGTLERLPMERCEPIPGECKNFVYGGVVHDVGLDGRGSFAVASAFVSSPLISPAIPPNVTEHKAISCAYPGLGASNKPADPARYPQGCDITDSQDNASNFLIPSLNPNGGAWVWETGSSKTHGPQYLGFAIRKVNAFQDGKFGAWGLWLNEGINCPSKDFFDCDMPHQ